ncbi:peptidase C14, caspase domain-containing protein [Mycena floridula]|nr:peptidase C14, caspase domain-containing protein [Mycena floridula]
MQAIINEPRPAARALLIGISGALGNKITKNLKLGGLKGAHKDVRAMKKLLIEQYGFCPADIVTLLDKQGSEQPTRANILRQIDILVKDAKAGDHFVFHYAGHSTQTENRKQTEEDDMDECIIPSDGEANIIKDDELRQRLVDPLPVGSNLVAILDSCHSASLLDLEHYRCNRVYVPWVSKGRRMTDTLWNINVRRQAIDVDVSVFRPPEARTTSASDTLRQRSLQLSIPTSRRSRKHSVFEHRYEMESPIQQCDSPVALFPCDGFCSPKRDIPKANVISLASCQDNQLAWDDPKGRSMTQTLVTLLGENPHPTLHTLMTSLSHSVYQSTIEMHAANRSWKKTFRNWYITRGEKPKSVEGVESDNFQDPQLSSHRPLDMNALFSL